MPEPSFMSNDSRSKAEAFKASVEEKIRNLIGEFAEGKLSREQFHVIYERYSSQLAIANQALITNTPEAVSIAQSGPATVAVRDALMGRALGLVIYHNRSGVTVETLGDFDVPVTRIAPILNDISAMMESKRLIDRRVEKVDGEKWLLFAAGRFTTVVTLFKHEPSPMQIRELERLHHDFEEANHTLLNKEQVDSTKLAYPFLIFLKQRSQKP
jgi:hypothetical protein